MNRDEWNAAVKVGAEVHRIMGDGRVLIGKTVRPALTMSSGIDVVLVSHEFNHDQGYGEFVMLSHLRVA